MAKVIKRGELWLVDLEPASHRELHKKRPALIISDNSIQETTPYVIIIPTSSQVPKTIGVEMVLVGEKEGLDKPSVLLPLFIRSIDQERLVGKIGKVSDEILAQIEDAIKIVLGIMEK